VHASRAHDLRADRGRHVPAGARLTRFTTVFLDRDGTLNVKAPEGEYITAPGELALLPGVGPAVRRLNDAGLRVVLVSNQRCIARGVATFAEVEKVNERLIELLAGYGARLDAIYLCPHDEGQCNCRKPLPGLLVQAAAEHRAIDLARSVIVGDAESDIEAGLAAGTASVRLAPSGTTSRARIVVPTLSDAVTWVFDAGSAAALG